jgi:bifunctional DNA-binding transcriptional regulator/antitoxin component of YhaV-PrlF toxin-antitoxin module
MIAQSVMHSAIEGKVTVSDKIRALAAAGASRSEIANYLGRSYQHVRQVLVEDERRRGVRVRPATPAKTPAEQPGRFEEPGLVASGPFRLTVDSEGRLVLPASALAMIGLRPGGAAVARLQDGELVLSRAEAAMQRARALVRSVVPRGISLADELLADRRRDANE